MPSFTIATCTVDVAAALARNNMSAFWTDTTWVLIWRGKTLEYVISQASRRMPQNLLTDPSRRRHQKAVDSVTGELVGYARWVLPEAGVNGEMDKLWPEARVPRISEHEARIAKKEYENADWEYDHGLDHLDAPITATKNGLMSEQNYLLLDYLAVHPDHRRQGIASMLVESGCREAEKLGLDIFVHAMKDGLGVHLRAGFELVEQIIQDDSKYGGLGEYANYFLVWRSAKTSTDGVDLAKEE